MAIFYTVCILIQFNMLCDTLQHNTLWHAFLLHPSTALSSMNITTHNKIKTGTTQNNSLGELGQPGWNANYAGSAMCVIIDTWLRSGLPQGRLQY